MAPRNLVLVGFMASGKSTIGAAVAQRLRVPFLDLDRRIEEMTESTITDLFASLGEGGFRTFEAAALRRALQERGVVIAVGGGAPMIDANWTAISDGNLVVRLRASEDETLRRVAGVSDRPLAGTGEAGRLRLLDLMREREARYAAAPHVVDTGGGDIEEVASEVVALAFSAGFPGGGG
ncbi:MAG: shikimate kinase [Candidatus Dormibacteria bacterium]